MLYEVITRPQCMIQTRLSCHIFDAGCCLHEQFVRLGRMYLRNIEIIDQITVKISDGSIIYHPVKVGEADYGFMMENYGHGGYSDARGAA